MLLMDGSQTSKRSTGYETFVLTDKKLEEEQLLRQSQELRHMREELNLKLTCER